MILYGLPAYFTYNTDFLSFCPQIVRRAAEKCPTVISRHIAVKCIGSECLLPQRAQLTDNEKSIAHDVTDMCCRWFDGSEWTQNVLMLLLQIQCYKVQQSLGQKKECNTAKLAFVLFFF